MIHEVRTNAPQLIVTLNVDELERLIRKSIADALSTATSKLQNSNENRMDEPLLSINDLCEKLQVSRDLVYRLRKEGRINGYVVGKRKFFRLSEVLHQCKVKREAR